MIILRKDDLLKFYNCQIQILQICQNLHCSDIFNIKNTSQIISQ